MTISPQHDGARQLLGWGLPVFPCHPAGKRPLTRNGFKDATRDPDQIEQWWARWPQANPALPTGAVSGVVVLDIDPRHHGTLTYLRLSDYDEPLTPLRAAWPVVVLTGGGGYHHYYRHPGRPVPCTSGRLHGVRDAPGLDVRGDGGYVLAPGAHTQGPYQALQPLIPEVMDPWPDQLTPPPPLPRPPLPAAWAGARPGHVMAPAGDRLGGLARWVADSPEGQRHDRLHWAARRAHDHIDDLRTTVAEAWAALLAAAERCGYPRREAEATLRSVLGDPP